MKLKFDTPNAFATSPNPNVGVGSIRDTADKENLERIPGVTRSGKTRAETPKILVLVTMLLLVIFAMKEAGKPENWEWMGFKNQATQPEIVPDSPNDSEGQVQPTITISENAFKSVPSDSQTPALQNLSEEKPKSDEIDVAADLSSIKTSINQASSSQSNPASKITSEFWHSIIGKMKPEQQADFLKLLRSMRTGEALAPETLKPYASLVSLIAKHRERFHDQLFDQLALAGEGTKEKKELSTGLFESQATWDDKILPAFEATVKGEDFTLDQLRAIHQLQTTIDPVLFDQVQDKTAIGWSGDKESWKRIWEIVLPSPAGALTPQTTPPSFEPATRLELMSQPKFYRGKPIKVEGWVRSARIAKLDEDSELGIPHQYILWVRPKETKQGPYCIYAHNLPADFPELSERFQDLNEQVVIDGYFFKIRTYVAADKSAITSPVIIASKLTGITPVQYTSVHNWQPSRSTFIGALILMPILATAIAWWAFRSSQTQTYQPGKKTAGKIDKTLGALASDPNVQTDREKIQALYDTDLHDSGPDDFI